MSSVAERLAEARTQLVSAGLSAADAAIDADVLACHLLGWDRATLLTRGRDTEPDGFANAFAALVRRRAAREPVAQIVGHREFWGLDFEVNRDVLVPRPETEFIVEESLAFARETALRHVIDVGTGTGCIAVAIAHELRDLDVTATDASPLALEVARRNAVRHHLADRIHFQQTDLLAGISRRAELIVSNPPYVPEADAGSLPRDVIRHEPREALFAGPTGLDVIERLLWEAPECLAPGGRLVVEFGFGQEPQVLALASQAGWRVVRVREDLQSIPRTIVLTRMPHG